MKERPILFSAPMIRAILSGAKTQTRRIVTTREPLQFLGPRGDEADPDNWGWFFDGPDHHGYMVLGRGHNERRNHGRISIPCPYGEPGDRLWVKHSADLSPVYYKPISGWEDLYAAGTDGRIYRVDRGDPEPLAGSPSSRGYLSVSLSRGAWKTHSVHRLVCETFYGPPPFEAAEARHLDGDKLNNRPENLDWGTAQQNWQDRKAHGRGMGEQHHSAKLTASQVAEIRRSSLSQRALAAQYGVSQSTIHGARSCATWTEHQPAGRNARAFSLWKSPIYMPRWASRITLEITDVRVQRLQEISEDDARAEGIEAVDPATIGAALAVCSRSPRAWFSALWDEINGDRALWSSNPWVRAITFRRIP